jgi:hypothetical protein
MAVTKEQSFPQAHAGSAVSFWRAIQGFRIWELQVPPYPLRNCADHAKGCIKSVQTHPENARKAGTIAVVGSHR